MDTLIFWDCTAPDGFQLPVSRAVGFLLGKGPEVHESPVLLNGYASSRRQIDAAAVLDALDIFRHRMKVKAKVLLIIGTDLFRPGDEFLFGLARPSAGVAVVSTARLCNEYYNLHTDEEIFVDRIAKEGMHELGHLLGLEHCSDPACIMYNPQTLEDLDRKKKQFCVSCQEKIDGAAVDDVAPPVMQK
jgi:Predicted Zn-dependent proteases